MTSAEFRPLTDTERQILKKLFEVEFVGRNELMQQLDGLKARPIDSEGSLCLEVEASVRAPVTRGVVVEARYRDVDSPEEGGPYVNILLHVIDGKMTELEIYKDDGSPIRKPPSPAELEVFTFFRSK